MKRVKIIIPPNRDEASAQWMFENSIRVLLSYSSDDFFGARIVIICGVPDETLVAFNTEFASFLKK